MIEINNLTGLPPFQIYFCDVGLFDCEFITSVDDPITYPIEINLPISFSGTSKILVKIIDRNNCETFSSFIC